jgi:Holliday junction resolvase RusA-like endonuclease
MLDAAAALTTVKFVVPGKPRGKQSVRVTRFGSFMPKQTEAEMEAVKYIALAAMHGDMPMAGPVLLRMCAYVPVPKGWSRADRLAALAGDLLPTVKPDGDNYMKLVWDACSRVVWWDDRQVTDWHGWKRYSDDPRIVVHVAELRGGRNSNGPRIDFG